MISKKKATPKTKQRFFFSGGDTEGKIFHEGETTFPPQRDKFVYKLFGACGGLFFVHICLNFSKNVLSKILYVFAKLRFYATKIAFRV